MIMEYLMKIFRTNKLLA